MGTGRAGGLDREKVMQKQEVNDGKSRRDDKTFWLRGFAIHERDDS